MNKSNILLLADHIERLPDAKFAMDELVAYDCELPTGCGSPSCIAGWAAWFQQGKPEYVTDNRMPWDSGENTLVISALTFFDTTDTDKTIRDELFRGTYCDTENERLAKVQAVATLRHFAETGEVDWEVGS